MRIALDARAAQTKHRHRGIGRSVIDLVHALAKGGGEHEYGLLVQASSPMPFDGLPANFQAVPVGGPLLDSPERSWAMGIPGLRSHPLGRLVDNALVRREHWAAMRRALGGFRPDVLHAAVPIDEFTDTTPDFGCRKVVTFYDAIPKIDPAHAAAMSWGARRQYDRQLAAVGRADAVVAISNSSREEAIRYAGADPDRTFVVHLAVPDDFERETHESVERFTKGEPYFLFLSALTPYKNPLGVVRAFAQARSGQRLVFVSSHESVSYGEVRAAIRDLGLEDAVAITDTVSDDAVRALVQGATALVSPSFYEGFGLPAAQAMRAGVPAIVSNRKSQPEVVGDAGIIVDPDDLDALAGAMRRIATDPAFRRDLSERGRARARLFSPERLARNMVDVYEGRAPSDPIPGL